MNKLNCLFSIKLPTLVKNQPYGIEILTLNTQFTVSEACFLTLHGVDFDVSIDTIVTQQNKNRMAFSTKDLVLIKVLRQEKGRDNC